MHCHFLLQGIFPTQGLNPCLLCLLHCRQILYPLLNFSNCLLTNFFTLDFAPHLFPGPHSICSIWEHLWGAPQPKTWASCLTMKAPLPSFPIQSPSSSLTLWQPLWPPESLKLPGILTRAPSINALSPATCITSFPLLVQGFTSHLCTVILL